MPTETFDTAIIGAGPAGIAAALTAAKKGLNVVLIDDAPLPGGHFYKYTNPAVSLKPTALSRKRGAEISKSISALRNSGVVLRVETNVWGIFDDDGATFRGRNSTEPSLFHLALDKPLSGSLLIAAKTLILSTGVYDRSIPFPGWHLPGIITTGAAQMNLQKQALLPGKKVLVAGSGPLQLIVAAELARYGAEVVGVADTSGLLDGFGEVLPALPGIFERVGELFESFTQLLIHRVPIFFNHAIIRADGSAETGVSSVTIQKFDRTGNPIENTQQTYEVDAVVYSYGFLPSTALTRGIGIEHRFDTRHQAFFPISNPMMETSIKGAFIAGDMTGAGGKGLSGLQGKLAAYSSIRYLDPTKLARQDELDIQRTIKECEHHLQFSAWLWDRYAIRPYLFGLIKDDTFVCRCEAVRLADIKQSLRADADGLFDIKLQTRVSMGQCQGRYCVTNTQCILSRETGVPVEKLGEHSVRAPILPIRMKDI